ERLCWRSGLYRAARSRAANSESQEGGFFAVHQTSPSAVQDRRSGRRFCEPWLPGLLFLRREIFSRRSPCSIDSARTVTAAARSQLCAARHRLLTARRSSTRRRRHATRSVRERNPAFRESDECRAWRTVAAALWAAQYST